MRRQSLIHTGGDLELARLRPRRQEFGDVFDQCGKCEWALFEVYLAGFDLGVVQQFLDQREKCVAGRLHRLGVGHLLRRQRRIHQQRAHADDAIERRADFVARHREEARLGAAGGIRLVARLGQRAFGLGAIGDVAADAFQLGRPAGIGSDQAFAPGDPSRPEPGRNLLVVDAGAVGLDCGIALLQHRERKLAADQRAARRFGKFAIGLVDEGDAAFRIAQHDQIALGFEQAAGALLGFLQFPITVGQRFVVERDLAHFLAHPAQPHAQRRQCHAGDSEQEAGADRESVGVIAGMFRPGAGNEAIGAAESGREDHERADRDDEPWMASREAP